MANTYKNNIVRWSYLWGVTGSVFLLAIYFVTLTLSNSFVHAIEVAHRNCSAAGFGR